MLEQAQSTSLSKQESVLQKQDRCKKTKIVTALNEKSQYHFSKTRLKDAASQQEEFLCDKTQVNYSQDYTRGTPQDGVDNRYKTLPLTDTVKQTGRLLRNPAVKLYFTPFSASILPKPLRACKHVLHFAMSLFQDGVILAADTPSPLDAVAHHLCSRF